MNYESIVKSRLICWIVVYIAILLYVNYFRNSEISGDMGIKKD